MKRITTIAVFLCSLIPVAANSAVTSWDRISFVGGFGVGVPLNGDEFQASYKESIYSTLRVEAELFKNVAVYGDWDNQTFDVEAGASGSPIETSSFGAGLMVFGNLNTFGTARAYLDLGLSGNTRDGVDKTWSFRPGVGADFNVDASGQAGVRLGCKWRNYDDEPFRVQAVMPQVLLRVTPGKVGL